MRLGAALSLIELNLKRNRGATVSSSFGIAVGVGCLVFFLALGLGIGRVVREKIFSSDSSMLEVVSASLALAPLPVVLDEAAVGRLAAIPGVKHAYRKMTLRVPASSIYDGAFFGRPMRMGLEILADGVEPEFVASDLDLKPFADPGPNQPMPALISRRLLDIYNVTFAPGRGLPRLGPAMLTGFTFPLDINRSLVTETGGGPTIRTQAKIAGVSERALLAGITIPLDAVRRLNAALGKDDKTYSSVALELSGPGDIAAVTAAVKALGFKVNDSEQRLAQQVGTAVKLATSAFFGLAALICLLAAFNISRGFAAAVKARETELALFRVVGAARFHLLSLVLGEALVLGLVGALIGTGVAVGLCRLLDSLARSRLPELPFQLDSFFALPWWLFALSIALGCVAALLGALGPAWRASAIDPARVLAGRTS